MRQDRRNTQTDLVPSSPTELTNGALTPEDAQDLLNSWLSGRSPRTLTAYRGDVERFAEWLGTDVPTATQTLVSNGPGRGNKLALDYRASMVEAGLAPSTVNRRLAALRSLVALARTLGMVTWAIEIRGVRSEAYRDTRGPGVDPIRSALDALAAEATPRALRDRAAVRLMFDLALRLSSVTSLDLAHVDLDRGTVSVALKGHGTERRTKSLPPATRQALCDWVAARGTAPGPLFTSFDRARKGDGRLSGRSLRRTTEALGLGHPHGLRHTAITQAVTLAQAEGIPLPAVLGFSDHTSLTVLQRYLDNVTDSGGRIAELVARLGEQRAVPA